VALVSLCTYYTNTSPNPVTGENQHVAGITPEQEVAFGLRAAPQMAAEFGGLDPDPAKQDAVKRMGQEIVAESAAGKSPYRFDFHVLDDAQTVNAFALPGGQIFITDALLRRLESPGQLAGILGHEIGHVVGRHAAEHIAKAQLTQGLTGAAVIASYDPDRPGSYQTAAAAALIGQLINLKYGRDDELESDKLGVRFMAEAGFHPESLIQVMDILEKAGGGGRTPDFLSTHPSPENRRGRIKEAIQETFPQGVPQGLTR
jgi:predicted Zn-dependent protease